MIFYKLLLNSGVSIPENAITYTAPSKLNIPNNTSGISKHSFSKGVGVIIPTTSTLPGVFAGTNVTSIGVPANITAVPKECFKGCSELQSFTGAYATEDGTMFIIDNKIMGAAPKSGVEFTIPASVTSIENYAFEGCSGTLRILCEKVPGGTSETNCPTKSGWLHGANFSKVDLASVHIDVGKYAFFEMSTLKEVVMGDLPVMFCNLGEGSFGNCLGLTSVKIIGLASINVSGAFYGCSNITAFAGDYATPDGRYIISKGKLQAAVLADTHVIPDSVTSIGRSLFRNDVISEITLPEGIETIEDYAFYNSKIGTINIPSTLKTIKSNTFGTVEAVNIASIDQWLSMDSYPFSMVSDTTNVTCNGEPITHLEFPEGTTSIKDNVARNFRDLVSVTLPAGVTSIGNYSFYKCIELETINLPENSNITIGDYAFAECSKLGPQLIFDSVSFGRQSFFECDSISSVHFKRYVLFDYNVFTGCNNINVVLDTTFSQNYGYTPFSSAGKEIVVNEYVPYANREVDSILFGSLFTKLTIGPNVTQIGGNFWNRSSIEEIHVSSIETWLNMTIGENNSLNGKTLNVNGQPIETLTIPGTINIIRERAFMDIKSIIELYIPDSVTKIDKYAFRSCSNIKSVSFGQNITEVGEYAFYSCDSIKDIYIKDLTKWCSISFGGDAWAPRSNYNIHLNGSLLEDLVIPIDIVRVNAYRFYRANLKSITIPSNVTIIGEYAFYGCQNVEEVAISSSVTSFGKYAFGYCGGVATIECNIPNYTSGTSSPFYNNNFSSIIIGDGVTQIGDNSFRNSNSLEILHIGDSVTYIGTNAFYNSYKLHTVTIGESVTLISGQAFAKTVIKNVYCKATTPPEMLDASLLMYGGENLKVYVPVEALDTYKTNKAWSNYKDYIFGYNFE